MCGRQICTSRWGFGFAVSANAIRRGSDAKRSSSAKDGTIHPKFLQWRRPAQLNASGLSRNLSRKYYALGLGGSVGVPPGRHLRSQSLAQQNAALEAVERGAELLVPVSQPSLLENTQPSQQTGVVEARLSRQREWMLASAAADREFSTHRANRGAEPRRTRTA